ncbi:MAG TPA: hypothetical protein VN688_16295 [Gemmataceae bacterium]|nr:hypothetical protein [Gemmataceae bacterium]
MCPINRWWCLMVCAASLPAGGVSAIHAEESARGQELRQLLSQPVRYPGVDDPKATVSDILEQLAKRYNLAFDINEHAFKDAHLKEVSRLEIATPSAIPEMHTKVGTVLQKVLLRISPSATYIIRDDVIEITTMKAVRKEFFPDRPTGPLPPLVSAAFDKVPLETALKQLSRQNHSIVVDARTAKEAVTPVTADLMNVPQDTAVRMLADMAGLTVVPLDNVLYVTSRDNAFNLMEEQERLRRQWRQHKKEEKDATKKPKQSEKPAPKSK